MAEYHKFLKIRFKIWWIIFICAQISILILMSHSFAAETWVKSDNSALVYNFKWNDIYNNIYDGDKFAGRLIFCKETCDKSYKKLSSKWCDLFNDLDNNEYYYEGLYYTKDAVEIYQSVCLMYISLFFGSIIVLAFEIASIVSIVMWIIGMLLYIKKKHWIWVSFVFSGCAWAFHYIAFIGYILVTKTNFDGDCTEFPNGGTKPKLCAGQGPIIMLVLAILIPIVCILFFIVACYLHKNHGNKGFRRIKIKNSAGEQPVVVPSQPIKKNEIVYSAQEKGNSHNPENIMNPGYSEIHINPPNSTDLNNPSCPEYPTKTVAFTDSNNPDNIEDSKSLKKH